MGLPMFLAAAMAVGGELGAYLVGPLFVGLLGCVTFVLARGLAGPWAGVIAATLITVSPITVLHAVYPMSDVPVTALWLLAWAMARRAGPGAAAAAGSAVAAAVMVRPNLVPLAAVMGTLVLTGGDVPTMRWREWRWRQAAVFTLFAAVGAGIVMWSQAVQYGGPFTPPYRPYEQFYRLSHIGPNLRLYPEWIHEVHTVIVFLGLASVMVVMRRGERSVALTPQRTIALTAFVVIAINYALYVPYINFAQWTYLRFVLPGLTALFILFAALVVWTSEWLAQRSRWLVPLALIPVAIVMARGVPLVRFALTDWYTQARVLAMAKYLREALPQNAVILCYYHSGTLAYATGRQIVRLDRLPDFLLDPVIQRLAIRRYRPVLVVDLDLEARGFQQLFAASTYHRLDWRPRAEFKTLTSIWLMDPADRDASRQGGRWPIDVVPGLPRSSR